MHALPRTASTLRRAALAASGLLLALAVCAGEDTASDDAIGSQELAARIAAGDAPLILDVRTPEEFADGHLPGARNVPHDALAGRLDELPVAEDDEIVVHCHSGRRATAAEEVLRDAGFTHVRDLTGHWEEWKRSGLPTE